MRNYNNYALGNWTKGDGEGTPLFNAITAKEIGRASSKGLDFSEMMSYARKVGGSKLRKMTFQERGLMLKALALHLHSIKNKFYALSAQTGATKLDSWIDIEGGIGNIFANASLRKNFPDLPYHVDGEMAPLSKNGTFIGHHIMTPREGVAIHINAFNFPIWGMLEKIAVNLMAGVPAIVKPATITCFLTEMMVREIVESEILPEGSLQLICGSAKGIINSVETGDIVTFTGSASTGMMLKANPRLIEKAVSFNMEADSLNCSVLGEDAIPGTASSPSTEQLSESASMLKETAFSISLGLAFNIIPVEADPVKVTISPVSTWLIIPLALPQINCKLPSGKILESTISRTIISVRKQVIVAGFTIAGTPAIRFTAIFSSIPQIGKLNAFI